MKKFWKWLKNAMWPIAVVLLSLSLSGCGITTTGGEHTGYITAVEKNGVIWKTGLGYIKTDVSSSQEEFFCIEDEELFTQLKEKSSKKELVTILFHNEILVAPWRCGTAQYIADGIK